MMNGYRSGRGRNVGNFTATQKSGRVARNVMMILLLVGLVVSLIMGVPAIQAKERTHEYVVARLATECRTAYDASQTLSLTGGTDSYDTLARIRSCVYAMQMMVSTDSQLDGHTLIEEAKFTSVYSIIESYQSALSKGNMATAGYVTNLQTTLSELYEGVLALQ